MKYLKNRNLESVSAKNDFFSHSTRAYPPTYTRRAHLATHPDPPHAPHPHCCGRRPNWSGLGRAPPPCGSNLEEHGHDKEEEATMTGPACGELAHLAPQLGGASLPAAPLRGEARSASAGCWGGSSRPLEREERFEGEALSSPNLQK
jgi:hypothetical protein